MFWEFSLKFSQLNFSIKIVNAMIVMNKVQGHNSVQKNVYGKIPIRWECLADERCNGQKNSE